MKVLFLILATFVFLKTNSQTALYNDSTLITSVSGALIYLEGNLLNESNGTFDNNGIIEITGNWYNNGRNYCFTNTNYGTVDFVGNNQIIGGSDSTKFFDLILNGGYSTKTLEINTEVYGVLNLVDAELQTNSNNITIQNGNNNAIVWNNGYVASDSLGAYLIRNINSMNEYFFPVGNNFLNGIYRGVTLNVTNYTDTNYYGVRLAAINPTYDYTGISLSQASGGFDVNQKVRGLNNINNNFYHNIIRLKGSDPINTKIYYFSSDGNFSTSAQWLSQSNQWEETNFTNISSSSIYGNENMVSINTNLNYFNYDVFALASYNQTLIIPQFISPNGDGKNDELIIENIEFYPNNKIEIFNRYGSIVYVKNGYKNEWKGNVNQDKYMLERSDNILPSGTYFYIFTPGEDIEPITGYVQIQK